ncbi:MAG: ABC transporter permease [Pseudomonadota bacterium]
MRRRLGAFRRNLRAWWSLIIVCVLIIASLGADLIANDKPLLVMHDGEMLFPVFASYAETRFGGDLETEADYTDPFVIDLIKQSGWAIDPPVPFAHNTVDFAAVAPHPAPPSAEHILGTDDQGRDVMARLVHGLRVSILFGLALSVVSVAVGLLAGAIQGFFGGWVDLGFQRFMEIWESLPQFYLLIIMSSFIVPGLVSIFVILALFSWMQLTPVVRAEVLRARNFDYVRAAEAMGVSRRMIIARHVLPNAIVAAITLLPFLVTGSIVALTSLDFIGFGLPPGSPSLGEMLQQARNNLDAPWLGITAFSAMAVLLTLFTFVGEGFRDAFDPRKTIETGGQGQ